MVPTGYLLREMARWTVTDDGRVFIHNVPDGSGGREDKDGRIDYLQRVNVAVLAGHFC